jgi:hypothetical protein
LELKVLKFGLKLNFERRKLREIYEINGIAGGRKGKSKIRRLPKSVTSSNLFPLQLVHFLLTRGILDAATRHYE